MNFSIFEKTDFFFEKSTRFVTIIGPSFALEWNFLVKFFVEGYRPYRSKLTKCRQPRLISYTLF